MRAYKTFDESDIEELGDITKEQIPALVAESEASLGGNKSFGVGLYRSEKDFMEIRPVGASEYMIWSDRILATKGVMGFLSRKAHIDKIVKGHTEAVEAAMDYIDQTREVFEEKYS